MAIRSMRLHTLEARLAPDAPSALPADADARDLDACQALLANGSRTFLAASRLLPRAVREPACALYAFCRLADDEVDGQIGGGAPTGEAGDGGAVARLRERLARVYAGRPLDEAADRALAVVVRRFEIPALLPEALIEGFEWDAAGRHYETLADVQNYAARVAGTVGAMMALLMGVRTPTGLARACDLGVAMQLSNIARDVGEDARLGRLYLPRQWLREAGVDPDALLAAPQHSPALGQVVQRLLREADALYQRVDAGVATLPLGCRPGINAARFLYAQIGLEVERRGLNPIDSRAVVSKRRKLGSLLRALLTLAPDDSHAPQPPLPATRHLVESVTGPLQDSHFRRPPPRRLAYAIDLFDKLERRERGWALAD
jgi:15-cis-phytoene synthase